MTTDITELAQREKFEAWLSEKPFHARYMHWSNTLNAYDYTGIQLAWEAYQVGGAELVEQLERARQYAKERDAENQELMLTVGRLRVEREELESRTVKLPKKNIGWDRDEDDCWNNAIDACTEALTAAGIKVETE